MTATSSPVTDSTAITIPVEVLVPSPTPLAYPASLLPQTISPYPGAQPNVSPTRKWPTPKPTVAVFPVDDCKLQPTFSNCDGIPLTGKLAYYQTDGLLTVLDLDAETAWSSTQTGLEDIYWSPTGSTLMAHSDNWYSYLYLSEGQTFDYYDHWLSWPYTRPAGTLIWLDDQTSAEIKYSTKDLDTKWYLEVMFHDGTGVERWSLEDPEFDYEVITILDSVPNTEWLLLGYAHGLVASRMVTGYQLKAINVRSGAVIDSGLAIPQDEHLDWHPSETGFMVTTDLNKSEIMGIGELVTWQVLDNQITYPLTSNQFVQAPAWSPDGRYLAYGAYDLSEGFQLTVMDTAAEAVEIWAESGNWPNWNRDGSMLFYLNLHEERNSALIQAIGRGQTNPWTIAIARFPTCPGLCQPQSVFAYIP